MPSTPRMIELERKASTPGEGLSRDEVTSWHWMNAKLGRDRAFNEAHRARMANKPRVRFDDPMPGDAVIDYAAANRYLDSPAWKAR